MRLDERVEREAAKRLDAFVDAAFAFAVSLLIIAGAEPLSSFEDLVRALHRIPAFAAGFALIAMFWMAHRDFGRLAPMRDGWTVLLSLLVVFFALVYVFPLRLLTESGMGFLSGGRLPGRELIDSLADLRGAYTVYGLGFAALAVLYALLYGHVARSGEQLGADSAARARGSVSRDIWRLIAAVGLISAASAWLLPIGAAPWAPGFAYWLIPLGLLVLSLLRRARVRAGQAPP